MARDEISRDFDALAPLYDRTRPPVDPEVLEALARSLERRGCRTVLEVGVGTGRVSLALRDRGVRTFGVDASRGMLDRARAKGLGDVVRGTAYRLPFPDGAFDAVLFVHVLHVLGSPGRALEEARRVATGGAFALLRPTGPDGREPVEAGTIDPREEVLRRVREKGVDAPERGAGPGSRERRLIAEHPPDEREVLADRTVTEPLARRLDLFEHRASRFALRVPAGVLAEAVAQVRRSVGDRTVTYRRVDTLARWRPTATPARSAGPDR